MNQTLFRKCQEQRIVPRSVCEVGVYLPETSNVLPFIEAGIAAVLVEADPEINMRLRSFFSDKANVELVPYAVYHTNGTLEFCRAGSSTFVRELESSPALKNDRFDKSQAQIFSVEARRFDEIDKGDIDLLSIDTEGCEWYVLKFMTSRPRVISVETGVKRYVNPHLNAIREWMQANDYELWYREASDSVFVRKGVLQETDFEKFKRKLLLSLGL